MAGRRVGRMSGLSLGTEWVYDGYAREILNRQGMNKSAWKGSLLLGHELLISRVRFNIHFGAYLYNPSGDIDPVYQRYSLYYRFGRHFLLGRAATRLSRRFCPRPADVGFPGHSRHTPIPCRG